MGAVLEVDGQILQIVADEILADDADDHAGGADVLLHARIDHAIIGNVAGLGEEHRRLVGNKDVSLGVGELLPGNAMDGLVLADIDIVGIFGDVEIGAVGNVCIVLILGGCGNDDLADLLRLGNGLLRPCAGLHIDGLAVLHQVHRDHGELKRCAALNEQDLIVVGNAHQIAKILLGIVDDLLEDGRTVAHFHDAHAASAVVHHFITDLLKDGFRHHRRACGEVEGTSIVHNNACLLNHCS